MTKADLLKILAKVPMHTTITFSSCDDGILDEEIERAYTVTGHSGLVLQLAPAGGREPADDDAEEIHQ